MTHALITGGAGFIGSHLAERLLDAGYTVTIIDNLSTGRIENIREMEGNPRFRSAIEDIRNVNVMDRLISECDVIFHLAAAVGVQRIISEPIETIETNIGGTEVVLKTARRYRKKVMIASTSEVYGKGVRFPFHEDDDSVLHLDFAIAELCDMKMQPAPAEFDLANVTVRDLMLDEPS